MKIKSIRELLEQLLSEIHEGNVTVYAISKSTGVGVSTLYKLRDGVSLIDNLSLINAEKLAQFQLDRNRK